MNRSEGKVPHYVRLFRKKKIREEDNLPLLLLLKDV